MDKQEGREINVLFFLFGLELSNTSDRGRGQGCDYKDWPIREKILI